jgi:endonuclease YncB( thermonuclease family)
VLLAALALSICPASGVRITCVHAGDTFIVNRERIRIMDADTPEINGKCAAESALAVKARDRLRVLLNSGDVTIHPGGKDRYCRTLAVVTVAGRSVGDQLVGAGRARTSSARRETWC